MQISRHYRVNVHSATELTTAYTVGARDMDVDACGNSVGLDRTEMLKQMNGSGAEGMCGGLQAVGSQGWVPGALSRCSSLSSVNTSSGVDVESPSETASLSAQHLIRSVRCSDTDARLSTDVASSHRTAPVDVNTARRELEQLIAERQRATELAMEKEEELYQLHESHLAEIAAQRKHLDELKAQHEAEWKAAWSEIELQRCSLAELQCKDKELGFADGSKGTDALDPLGGSDTSHILAHDIELRQKAAEAKYSEQMTALKKAEDDLLVQEEHYKHEDEARLEKLSAKNAFLEKLDTQKLELIFFIEEHEQKRPAGFETSLPFSLSRSESNLDKLSDGWQKHLPTTVSCATGRLSSKHKGVEGKPVIASSGQNRASARHGSCEIPADVRWSPELTVPWKMLSDDPDVKCRSASAPRLSDEASSSCLSDETQTVQLRRGARSPSPRTTRLSNLSLVSVPESIHEEYEESSISGRLSVSEVDIRRHKFASSGNRNRWSLDEEKLSGVSGATSIRCLAGSNQDVVITDSGLPSSPEAGRLDSSVSSGMNTVAKRKEKANKQSDVPKFSRKSEPGMWQKIGATLSNFARQQDSKSSKSTVPVLPLRSKISRQRTETEAACGSRSKDTSKRKTLSNASGDRKMTNNQSKSKLKQPPSSSPVSKRHSSTAIKEKSVGVQDQSAKSPKVRDTFRSFRERLKLGDGKLVKRKSGDIPVEIFLPKSKAVDNSKDNCDLLHVEKPANDATNKAVLERLFHGKLVSHQPVFSQLNSTTRGISALSESDNWSSIGVSHGLLDKSLLVVPRRFDGTKGCNDEGEFSDDSLNGDMANPSYYQGTGLRYEHRTRPDYGGQHYVTELTQTTYLDTNLDDGSFSEDSLAEGSHTYQADGTAREVGRKPTAVLLPCNTRTSTFSTAATSNEMVDNRSEASYNRLFGTPALHLVNQDVVEQVEDSALCTSDMFKLWRLTEVRPLADIQTTPVYGDYTALPVGTFAAAHQPGDDSTSISTAGRSSDVTKSSSQQLTPADKLTVGGKKDSRSRRADILRAIGRSTTTESDVTEGAQSAPVAVAAVKRRKRRVPAVHDTIEPSTLHASSDDYAVSSADISSSSSSEEDNDGLFGRHAVKRDLETLSDYSSACVFWIPNSTPLNSDCVSTVDSELIKDVSTTCSQRRLHLGCCKVDLWNNVSDMKNDDAICLSDTNTDVLVTVAERAKTVEDSEKTKCGKLARSQTLIVDTVASSQNWYTGLTTLMSHSDLCRIDQEDSDAVSKFPSYEDRRVAASEHPDLCADVADHSCAVQQPSSSIASDDVSSDYTSLLRQKRKPASAQGSHNCSFETSEVPLSRARRRAGMQQKRESDASNPDSPELQQTLLRYAEAHNRDSGYQSVSRQSALLLRSFHTSEDQTDLTAGDDAFVEVVTVEENASHQQDSDEHWTDPVSGRLSIGMDEPSVRSEETLDICQFDGNIGDKHNRSGGSDVKESGQMCVESLVAVDETNEDLDDSVVRPRGADEDVSVVCPSEAVEQLTDGTVLRHRKRQPTDGVSRSQSVSHATRPRSWIIGHPAADLESLRLDRRRASLSLSRLHLQSSSDSDNVVDSSVPDIRQGNMIDHGRFRIVHSVEPQPRGRGRQRANLPRLRPMSAEASPLMQQLLQYALQDRQASNIEPDPIHTENAPSSDLPTQSFTDQFPLSLNRGNTPHQVTDPAVSSGVHNRDLVPLSGGSEPVNSAHGGPNGDLSVMCRSSVGEGYPLASGLEPQRNSHTTVVLPGASELLSVTNVASHDSVADALAPADGITEFHTGPDVQESAGDSLNKSHDRRKHAADRDHRLADEMCDVIDRNMMRVKRDGAMELSVAPVGSEKATENERPADVGASPDTLSDRLQMWKSTDSDQKKCDVIALHEHRPVNQENLYLDVEGDADVREMPGTATTADNMEQKQEHAAGNRSRLVDVNKYESNAADHTGPHTDIFGKVFSHQSVVCAETEDSPGDHSLVTGNGEVVTAYRQRNDVHQLAGSEALNTVTPSGTILVIGQETKVPIDTVSEKETERHNTHGIISSEVISDTPIIQPNLTVDHSRSAENIDNEVNETSSGSRSTVTSGANALVHKTRDSVSDGGAHQLARNAAMNMSTASVTILQKGHDMQASVDSISEKQVDRQTVPGIINGVATPAEPVLEPKLAAGDGKVGSVPAHQSVDRGVSVTCSLDEGSVSSDELRGLSPYPLVPVNRDSLRIRDVHPVGSSGATNTVTASGIVVEEGQDMPVSVNTVSQENTYSLSAPGVNSSLVNLSMEVLQPDLAATDGHFSENHANHGSQTRSNKSDISFTETGDVLVCETTDSVNDRDVDQFELASSEAPNIVTGSGGTVVEKEQDMQVPVNTVSEEEAARQSTDSVVRGAAKSDASVYEADVAVSDGHSAENSSDEANQSRHRCGITATDTANILAHETRDSLSVRDVHQLARCEALDVVTASGSVVEKGQDAQVAVDSVFDKGTERQSTQDVIIGAVKSDAPVIESTVHVSHGHFRQNIVGEENETRFRSGMSPGETVSDNSHIPEGMQVPLDTSEEGNNPSEAHLTTNRSGICENDTANTRALETKGLENSRDVSQSAPNMVTSSSSMVENGYFCIQVPVDTVPEKTVERQSIPSIINSVTEPDVAVLEPYLVVTDGHSAEKNASEANQARGQKYISVTGAAHALVHEVRGPCEHVQQLASTEAPNMVTASAIAIQKGLDMQVPVNSMSEEQRQKQSSASILSQAVESDVRAHEPHLAVDDGHLCQNNTSEANQSRMTSDASVTGTIKVVVNDSRDRVSDGLVHEEARNKAPNMVTALWSVVEKGQNVQVPANSVSGEYTEKQSGGVIGGAVNLDASVCVPDFAAINSQFHENNADEPNQSRSKSDLCAANVANALVHDTRGPNNDNRSVNREAQNVVTTSGTTVQKEQDVEVPVDSVSENHIFGQSTHGIINSVAKPDVPVLEPNLAIRDGNIPENSASEGKQTRGQNDLSVTDITNGQNLIPQVESGVSLHQRGLRDRGASGDIVLPQLASDSSNEAVNKNNQSIASNSDDVSVAEGDSAGRYGDEKMRVGSPPAQQSDELHGLSPYARVPVSRDSLSDRDVHPVASSRASNTVTAFGIVVEEGQDMLMNNVSQEKTELQSTLAVIGRGDVSVVERDLTVDDDQLAEKHASEANQTKSRSDRSIADALVHETAEPVNDKQLTNKMCQLSVSDSVRDASESLLSDNSDRNADNFASELGRLRDASPGDVAGHVVLSDDASISAHASVTDDNSNKNMSCAADSALGRQMNTNADLTSSVGVDTGDATVCTSTMADYLSKYKSTLQSEFSAEHGSPVSAIVDDISDVLDKMPGNCSKVICETTKPLQNVLENGHGQQHHATDAVLQAFKDAVDTVSVTVGCDDVENTYVESGGRLSSERSEFSGETVEDVRQQNIAETALDQLSDLLPTLVPFHVSLQNGETVVECHDGNRSEADTGSNLEAASVDFMVIDAMVRNVVNPLSTGVIQRSDGIQSVIPDSLYVAPQRSVEDDQELAERIVDTEHRGPDFSVKRRSKGGEDDELLSSGGGRTSTTVLIPCVVAGVTSSTVTENFGAEGFVMADAGSTRPTQHMLTLSLQNHQGASTECHITAVEAQQVNDEASTTNADVVIGNDDVHSTAVSSDTMEATYLSHVGGRTGVAVNASSSGAAVHASGQFLGDKYVSDWQSRSNPIDILAEATEVDTDGTTTESTSAAKSADAGIQRCVDVSEHQQSADSLHGLQVSRNSTDIDSTARIAHSPAIEQILLMAARAADRSSTIAESDMCFASMEVGNELALGHHNVPSAGVATVPVSHYQVTSTEPGLSTPTVSSAYGSGMLADDALKETEESKASIEQNPAVADVNIESDALHGTSPHPASSTLDHIAVETTGSGMQQLKQGRDIKTNKQRYMPAVAGDDVRKHLPSELGDAEQSAIGSSYDVTTHYMEDANRTSVVNDDITVCPFARQPDVVTDGFNNQSQYTSVTEQEPSKECLAAAEPVEFSKLQCGITGAKDGMADLPGHMPITAHEDHALPNKETHVQGVESDTKKLYTEDERNKIGKNQDMSIAGALHVPLPNLDYETPIHMITASAYEEDLNTDNMNVRITSDGSTKTGEKVQQKCSQLDSDHIVCVPNEQWLSGKEASDIVSDMSVGSPQMANVIDPASVARKCDSDVDSSSMVDTSSAIPIDEKLEVQEMDIESTVLSCETEKLSLPSAKLLNISSKESDGNINFDVHGIRNEKSNSDSEVQNITSLLNLHEVIDEVAVTDKVSSTSNATTERGANSVSTVQGMSTDILVADATTALLTHGLVKNDAYRQTDARQFATADSGEAFFICEKQLPSDERLDTRPAGRSTQSSEKGYAVYSESGVNGAAVIDAVVVPSVAASDDDRSHCDRQIVDNSRNRPQSQSDIATFAMTSASNADDACIPDNVDSQYKAGTCSIADEIVATSEQPVPDQYLRLSSIEDTTVHLVDKIHPSQKSIQDLTGATEQLSNSPPSDGIALTPRKSGDNSAGSLDRVAGGVMTGQVVREFDAEQVLTQIVDPMIRSTAVCDSESLSGVNDAALQMGQVVVGQPAVVSRPAYGMMTKERNSGNIVPQMEVGSRNIDNDAKEPKTVENMTNLPQLPEVAALSSQQIGSGGVTAAEFLQDNTALLPVHGDAVTSDCQSEIDSVIRGNVHSPSSQTTSGLVTTTASDVGTVICQQQPLSTGATAVHATFDRISSSDVAFEDQYSDNIGNQKGIDGHTVDILRVPAADQGRVGGSDLDLLRMTKVQGGTVKHIDEVSVMIGDDNSVILTGVNATEHQLPATVRAPIQAHSAVLNYLLTSTPGEISTTAVSEVSGTILPHSSGVDSNICETATASSGIVSGSSHAASCTTEHGSGLPHSVGTSNAASSELAYNERAIIDSSSRSLRSMQEMNKTQHNSTFAGTEFPHSAVLNMRNMSHEEASSPLGVTDDNTGVADAQDYVTVDRLQPDFSRVGGQYHSDVVHDMSAHLSDVGSRTCTDDKSLRETVATFKHGSDRGEDGDLTGDSRNMFGFNCDQNIDRNNTLSTDGQCDAASDSGTKAADNSEKLSATKDSDRISTGHCSSAGSGDSIAENAVTDVVVAAKLNVPDTQTVTAASVLGTDASEMSVSCVDTGQSSQLPMAGDSENVHNGTSSTALPAPGHVLTEAVGGQPNVQVTTESSRRMTVPDVEMTYAPLSDHLSKSDGLALKVNENDDSVVTRCPSEQVTSPVQPHQAVSHPSHMENVRSGSNQTLGDRNVDFSSPSYLATQSVASNCSLPVPQKSVDSKVENPGISSTKNTVGSLSDTEVLGIDLNPEKQCSSDKSASRQSSEVEIVMSGHSTIGFGQHTNTQFQSIGLQPAGTQQPQFIPGPQQVLRDDLTDQYPVSFSRSALDVEIRPRNRGSVLSDEEQLVVPPGGGRAHISHAAAVDRPAGSSKGDSVSHREVKDGFVVTKQNRGDGALRNRDRNVVTGLETVEHRCVMGDVNKRPDQCHITVNREISPQPAASFHEHGADRSPIFDLDGLGLFRSQSVENVQFAGAQMERALTRSCSDVRVNSGHRYYRGRRRRLAQPVLNKSGLSKSDQELLGSTSALFEDLLPQFKDLPFSSSTDGSDLETDEQNILYEPGGLENVPPLYHNLPSPQVSNAQQLYSEHLMPRTTTSSGYPSTHIDGSTLHQMRDTTDKLIDDVHKQPIYFQFQQPFTISGDNYRKRKNISDQEPDDDIADPTQSVESITYVFGGHGASSLEEVGGGRCNMVRYSSVPSAYPCRDDGDSRYHIPVQYSGYGILTESSSDSCLLSTETECPTPTRRSLSFADADEFSGNDSRFSDDFSPDIWNERQRLPATQRLSGLEPDRQTSDATRPLKRAMPSATFGQREIAIQTNLPSFERHDEHLPTGRSLMEVETQTEQHPQSHVDGETVTEEDKFADMSDQINAYQTQDSGANSKLLTATTDSVLASASATPVDQVPAAGRHSPSDMHTVNKSLLGEDKSGHRPFGEITQSRDHGNQLMAKSRTVENLPSSTVSAVISAVTHRTQSLQYGMDDQGQRSTGNILRFLSGRTIETQTYPERRAIETQTSNEHDTCGTQTAKWNDMGSGEDGITSWGKNVPLTVSVSALSPELCSSPVNRPNTELTRATDVISSPVTSSQPSNTVTCAYQQTSSHRADGGVYTGFTRNQAGEQVVTTSMPQVMLPVGESTDWWTSHPSLDVSSHSTAPAECGLSRYYNAQTMLETSSPQFHPLLAVEGLRSRTALAGLYDVAQTVHSAVPVNTDGFTSPSLASVAHNMQPAVGDGWVINAAERKLQHSASLAGSVGVNLPTSYPGHQDMSVNRPVSYHSLAGLSDSSALYSASATLSPASNTDMDISRTKDSSANETRQSKYDDKSTLETEKILQKYRMKGKSDRDSVGQDVSGSSVQHYDYMRLSPSAVCLRASSSYSQANDSGFADSQHSVSALGGTVLGRRSETIRDRSTATEAAGISDPGWDDELERLRQERQQIIIMLTREVMPSRIQVELIEAHLNYLLGQTDAFLQNVDEPVTLEHDQRDFHAFCRARLEASQKHIEEQIRHLEMVRREAQLNALLTSEPRDDAARTGESATLENSYLTEPSCDSPGFRHRLRNWSPSERERYFLGIRREIVAATQSRPVRSSHSRWSVRDFRRCWPDRACVSANSSYQNLDVENSVHEAVPRSDSSFATATPTVPLQHRPQRRHGILASAADVEIHALLTECHEARLRSQMEVYRALDTIHRTAPRHWADLPLSSSHRQLSFSSPRLLHDEWPRRIHSTYSMSSDRLNGRQSGAYENSQPAMHNVGGSVNTQSHLASTDTGSQRYTSDPRFHTDLPPKTVISSTPQRPVGPELFSSQHSSVC